MCQEAHKNAEFPVNKSLKNLMRTSPSEIFRSDLVKAFKANLDKIESKKAELEKTLLNGADRFREHCIDLRLDVDFATETAIEEIKQHRDTILKQINDYESETVALIQIKVKTRNEFSSSIRSMDEFSKGWKSYLTRSKIDEKEVARGDEAAMKLIRKAEREESQLNSFVFNKKMILFAKHDKSIEMSNIGFVKYKHVGCIDLKDLKIDFIKIVQRGSQVQVYPHYLMQDNLNRGKINRVCMQDDQSLYLFYNVAGYGTSSHTVKYGQWQKEHFTIENV